MQSTQLFWKETKMFAVTRRADDNTKMEPTDSKLQGIISCFDQFYNVRLFLIIFFWGGVSLQFLMKMKIIMNMKRIFPNTVALTEPAKN